MKLICLSPAEESGYSKEVSSPKIVMLILPMEKYPWIRSFPVALFMFF
jgi:hypothetical protein